MKQGNIEMAKQENKKKKNSKDNDSLDSELQNIIEAALYAAKEPLGVRKIMAMFPDDAQPSTVDIQNAILRLEELCVHRGVELKRIGKGWRFQTKEKYSTWLRKLGAQKPPRYSRALLETLSIIAYRQPVTRGDIEEIRGVGVSSETIRTLEEREWVAAIGHRDVPGRPTLFGTTQAFLEYFNMSSLRELPELMDRRDLGEIAKEMNLTLPMDGVQGEDEAAAEQGRLSDLAEDDDNANSESAKIIELHPEAEQADEGNATPEKTKSKQQADELEADSLEAKEETEEPSSDE